jgi:hypothetical protein
VALNASIITDTAKDITKRTVVDYGAGVYAHTTQDWAKHNCISIRLHNAYTGGSAEQVATQSLRMLLTLDDGSAGGLDQAILTPLNPSGISAITNSPPIIIQQPANKIAPPNSTVQLIVAAISDIALTFQWYKKNTTTLAFDALTGKTATTLVMPAASSADNGDYRVVVTNANGSVTSSTANVLVSAGASGSEGDGFYESLPGVRLFRAIFG